jgi:putative addiction module component (TIGR02574 family)
MHQGALARAIAPVLKGGKHDGVIRLAHGCYDVARGVCELENLMAQTLDKLETEALQLSPKERGELIHRLIVSLESETDDTPEAIAQAWDEEIARRVADMDAGKTVWIPAEEVFARLDAIIENAR